MPMGTENETISQEELDSILDAALDELDDDSESDEEGENDLKVGEVVDKADHLSKSYVSGIPTTTQGTVFGPERPPIKDSTSSTDEKFSPEEAAINDMMRHMEALFPSDATKKEYKPAVTQKNDVKDSKVDYSNEGVSSNHTKNHEKMEETMSKLFQKLSQNMNDSDLNENDFSGLGDDFMKEMAKEWESTMRGSGDEDQEEVVGQVVDGMMKQLLSKEFMYEPMKDICNQFPKWLAENKDTLDEKEYKRYGTQYQYFQRIVHVYEYDPNNVSRLTELMQEIQEYGQPPPELIKELAPDLDFDKDGIPKMDGAGLGSLMNEECCIM